MKSYMDSWAQVAAGLFSQAIAGEPQLIDSVLKMPDQSLFGITAILSGDEQGSFTVLLDGELLEVPLLGEGVDQKRGWNELLRETFDAAAGELLARSGRNCRVERVEEGHTEGTVTRAFQLKSDERTWAILVRDELQNLQGDPAKCVQECATSPERGNLPRALSAGYELLFDVELEASLRFGCREMPLGELLDLGPGDVVQLDRHVSDPVDLIVGDKIVARGEVVLVDGNFGLRVSEVAAPTKRLESIRCLF